MNNENNERGKGKGGKNGDLEGLKPQMKPTMN